MVYLHCMEKLDDGEDAGMVWSMIFLLSSGPKRAWVDDEDGTRQDNIGMILIFIHTGTKHDRTGKEQAKNKSNWN